MLREVLTTVPGWGTPELGWGSTCGFCGGRRYKGSVVVGDGLDVCLSRVRYEFSCLSRQTIPVLTFLFVNPTKIFTNKILISRFSCVMDTSSSLQVYSFE